MEPVQPPTPSASSASSIQFRDVPEAGIDRALSLAYLAFHESPEEEKRKHHHDLLLGCTRIGAYDGDELVGFLAAFPFTISVPGGELPCPSVTFVSVAPTHRRRGVLSGMIAELFAKATAEAAPIAALWASEDAIYGRFGFGPATHGNTVEIDSRRPLALRIAPDERPLRLLDPSDAPDVLGPYYDRTRAERPGRLVRTEAWWREEWMVTEDEEDDELSPPRIVTLGSPDAPGAPAEAGHIAGYAIYRTKTRDDAPGLVRLDDLEADTPAAAAALWRYLASIDLTGQIRAWGRPLDDPLLLFAADRDQVRVTGQSPALWVRLIDVRAALTARSWAAPVDAVIDVRDDRLPANAGRHRLTASPEGCTYERTDRPADLTLDIRDLAAAYLGGTAIDALVRAGLAQEHTPGTATALDAALHTDRLPHTVDEF
ncbi:GNAT family N-acetyltransferase [Streptomyces sp. WAC 01529]|uniref:GNAT family N-acetyltransferase n=1 Tax=Streptomyces sp. WAC 01529 TaxID=2203205 RepID=UPI000F6D608E|nr:GNAT family N-acetyltransferase [Streptomyces sp. WAC 01529]AZM53994.1 GNAT family N-acetyltransferase [Streptomyces sp. WAC 01529]